MREGITLQAQAAQPARQRRRGGGAGMSFKALVRAIRYLGNHRRSTFLAYGALLVASVAQLAVPKLVQNMITSVTTGITANGILSIPLAPLRQAAATQMGTTVDQLKLDQANAETLLINAAVIIVAFAIMRALFSFVQAFMADRKSVV